MEYMRLEGFLGKAVSKLINKGVESKFGYKPNIQLNNFKLSTEEEDLVVVNMSIAMKQSDFDKLIEEVTK